MSQPAEIVSTERADLSLIEDIRQGDFFAFRLLANRHVSKAFRIARSLVTDDGLAQRCVWQCHCQVFSQLRVPFSLGISYDLWIRRRIVQYVSTLPAADRDKATRSTDPLEEAIDSIPQIFRSTFVLRVLEELSGSEASQCLQVKPSTIRSRLFRAQSLLTLELLGLIRERKTEIFQLSNSNWLSLVDRICHETIS